MVAFSSRRAGYKVGTALLILSLFLFLVGFCTPDWGHGQFHVTSVQRELTLQRTWYSLREGLWSLCLTVQSPDVNTTACAVKEAAGVPDWLHVVRFLQCVCLLGLGAASVYTVVVNCFRTIPGPRSRFVESTTLASGVCGVLGAVMYAVLVDRQSRPWGGPAPLAVPRSLHEVAWRVAWGLHVVIVSAAISLLAAFLVCACNPPSNHGRVGGQGRLRGQGSPQGQGVRVTALMAVSATSSPLGPLPPSLLVPPSRPYVYALPDPLIAGGGGEVVLSPRGIVRSPLQSPALGQWSTATAKNDASVHVRDLV